MRFQLHSNRARQGRIIRKLASLALLPFALAFAAPVTADERAYNPHPAANDIILPMPGGYKMVFVPVSVPGKGFWGGSERIFDVGSKTKRPFEPGRTVRIGGSFLKGGDSWILVTGKYEVTIGQYAAMMGDGVIDDGLKLLVKKIGGSNPKLLKRIGPDAREKGKKKALALPLTSIGYYDYLEFIGKYNDWCLRTSSCVGQMRKALGAVGFLRLPTEVEWEYIARGGEKTYRANAAMPVPMDQLKQYANVDNFRGGTKPIGTKKPINGIYDMFGNVAELMAQPFTMDYGFGSVGGGVVRGGDFRTALSDMRVTRREEVPLYRKRTDGLFVKGRQGTTGLRLMIGAMVKTRTRIAKMVDEFRTAYVPIETGGDEADAGNFRRAAKDLDLLRSGKSIRIAESVGGKDLADHFRVRIPEFGRFTLALTSTAGSIIAELRHRAQRTRKLLVVPAGQTKTAMLADLPPGPIRIKIYPARGGAKARYEGKLAFKADDPAGNLAREALDLRSLTSATIEKVQFVGRSDKVDFYKFRLPQKDSISIRLVDLTGDVNVELLDGRRTKLKESINPRRTPESIKYENAEPGVYYVRVYSNDNRPARYKLLLGRGAVDTAGATTASARNLGVVESKVVSVDESLSGTDRKDMYKFAVRRVSIVTIQLSKMRREVDLFLFDKNRREVSRSRAKGTKPEKISTVLQPGLYYIEARGYDVAATPYYMTLESRPAAKFGHWKLAYNMPVSVSSPGVMTSTVSDKAPERWAYFSLSQSSVMRFNLTTPRNPGSADLDVVIWKYGSTGWKRAARVARSGVGGENFARSLGPGKYYVKVLRYKGGDADFKLVVSRSTEMLEPNFTGIQETHKDWKVGVWPASGKRKKECYAFTTAQSVRPSGWRAYRPTLFVSVLPGDKGVLHYLDKRASYRKNSTWTATISGSSGFRTIPAVAASAKATDVRSLERCNHDRSKWCVSNSGLRGLTLGRTLTLEGTTTDGRSAEISYSLLGYQAAIRAMNRLCNNARNTGWLIRR